MSGNIRRLVLAALLLAASLPAFGADCDVPGNLVSNCGFDTDEAGWAISADLVTGETSDCTTGPRCITVDRHDGVSAIELISACIDVNPSSYFTFGGWLKRVSGVIFQGCSLSLYEYSNKVCGPVVGATFYPRQPAAAWRELRAGHEVSGSTLSVKLRVYCSDENDDFLARVDDFFVIPAIFTDGFESGNRNFWTSGVP